MAGEGSNGATWWVGKPLARYRIIYRAIYTLPTCNRLSSDKPVSFEELGKFELFNRCMKESARIHTVVTVNSRVVEEDVEVNGVILPAKVRQQWCLQRWERQYVHREQFSDPSKVVESEIYWMMLIASLPVIQTNILVNHSATHHDPAIWDDPEEFKPDRFLPTDNDTHHPLDYSPFGAGPRVCIGERIAKMEYRYMCIEFLRRFKVCNDVFLLLLDPLHKSRNNCNCNTIATCPDPSIFSGVLGRRNSFWESTGIGDAPRPPDQCATWAPWPKESCGRLKRTACLLWFILPHGRLSFVFIYWVLFVIYCLCASGLSDCVISGVILLCSLIQ